MKMNRLGLACVIVAFLAFTSGFMVRAGSAVDAMVEADHNLNVAYKKLMNAIPNAAQKEKLKASQKAWLAWVVAEDDFRTALEGTSKAGLFAQIEMFDARSAQFEELLLNR